MKDSSNLKTFGSKFDSIFGNEIVEGEEAGNSSSSLIFINNIKPRKDQPRKFFDDEKHREFVASVKKQGIIQPIVVRTCADKTYEIIVGERRWRAAREAGLIKIPAIIKDYSSQDVMIVALMENIHRQDLNSVEEALAIKALISEFSLTHEQVAERIGKARVTVTNLLRLLDLNEEVKSLLERGLLEMGHAKALLSLDDTSQIDIANMIISKALSVRQTELLVQNLRNRINSGKLTLRTMIDEKKLDDLKSRLSQKFHSKVNLHIADTGQSRVTIKFDNIDALTNFVEKVFIEN